MLAIPLHRVAGLNPLLFEGKIVIDAMNYWPPVDGVIDEFEGALRGSSMVVRRLLPGAQVVKTFNHTGYHDLEPDRRSSGDASRLALAIAGDDPEAVQLIAGIIDRIGYDSVTLDSLEDGVVLEPGGVVFGSRLNAGQMIASLKANGVSPPAAVSPMQTVSP